MPRYYYICPKMTTFASQMLLCSDSEAEFIGPLLAQRYKKKDNNKININKN